MLRYLHSFCSLKLSNFLPLFLYQMINGGSILWQWRTHFILWWLLCRFTFWWLGFLNIPNTLYWSVILTNTYNIHFIHMCFLNLDLWMPGNKAKYIYAWILNLIKIVNLGEVLHTAQATNRLLRKLGNNIFNSLQKFLYMWEKIRSGVKKPNIYNIYIIYKVLIFWKEI